MPGLDDKKSEFAPAVKASRGPGGRHGDPFELPILSGAGAIFLPHKPIAPPKPIEELMDIRTPGSRLSGINVSRVMKEYKPISKVLKEKEF